LSRKRAETTRTGAVQPCFGSRSAVCRPRRLSIAIFVDGVDEIPARVEINIVKHNDCAMGFIGMHRR
jgi:hypothetical protein